ncbi:MAG: hypothetical protein ACLRZH_05690 [Ruthenibacterium lactatiformans]
MDNMRLTKEDARLAAEEPFVQSVSKAARTGTPGAGRYFQLLDVHRWGRRAAPA